MARNSMDLFSLLPTTSHNYYSGVIPSIPFIMVMASERLNLPPVASDARITHPANKDTALFILLAGNVAVLDVVHSWF